jgi:penicillin-binding protein 1A
MALPIWGLFMKKCYADDTMVYKISEKPFERPSNLSIPVDCAKAAVKDTTKVDSLSVDEFDF